MMDVEINDAQVRQALKRFGDRAVDFRKVWRLLFQWWARETARAMKVPAVGGTFKRTGKKWAKLTGLPKPRKRGTGMTLGRKRKRGGRLTPSTPQLRDTDAMLTSATSAPAKITKDELVIAAGGTSAPYAKHASKDRDWMTWTRKGYEKAVSLVHAYWNSLIAAFNRG
jgi:hypothetical protein